MLRGIRAKIRVTILGILVLCGSAVVINAFADGNYEIIYAETDLYSWQDSWQNIVELDGVNGSDFNVSLNIEEYYYIVRDIEGYFTANEGSYITADSCNKVVSDSVCDVSTGYFHLENDSDNTYYNAYTVHYTVSPDTPAGVYDLAIHTENYLAQGDDEYVDLDSAGYNPVTHLEIIVKRPQEVIFKDANGNPVTEITKYYGDEDFVIHKEAGDDAEITSYYVDGDENVVSIVDDTDYIHVEGVGSVNICASAEETDYYYDNDEDSCFTVNVEKKPIVTYDIHVFDGAHDDSIGVQQAVVDLNGTDDAEVVVALRSIDTIRMLSMDGSFRTSEKDDEQYGSRYINATDFYSMSICEEKCDFNLENGYFYFDFGDIDVDGNWFGEDEEIVKMVYKISSDTPSGVYNLPIQINDLQGRNMDDGTDFDEDYFEFDTIQIVVRRPQNIVFRDETGYSITEINKTYGDSDFEVTKEVYYGEGDGEIIDYYIESSHSVDEGEGNVVDIVPNSDYIHINKAGSAEICAVASETEFYLETTACYTINVENKEIWVKDLTVADKRFDGSSDAEIDELTFYTLDSEDNQVDINIDPAYYFIDKVELDDPNVGETTANIEIYLTGEGAGRYYLAEGMYTAPVTISQAYLQTFRNITVDSQEYDAGNNCQHVPIYVEAILDEESDLDIELYEGIDFNLFYMGEELYNETCLTEVGDYNLTVNPDATSNLTFDPFDVTFTINPYKISSSNISLSESTYKYNGTSQTPSVTVTVGETTIDEDDYNVVYSADTIGNDESDTTVTVTITAKEGANITGSASTTYTITPRDIITIAGIEDNQQIGYTGSPVALDGNVMVEENEGGITAEDLIITWYASDGTTVIDQPTNAGSYKVVYSYEDADYRGALVINFEITKADSPTPAEMETDFRTTSGQTLANLEGERTVGFTWADDSATVAPGNNVYPATYTYNNDPVNYETLNLNVPVYGLTQVDVITPENEGGEISASSQNVLEGETVTITITPDFGYVLSSITVNGISYIGNVEGNTLLVVAETSDLEIVATFAPITYRVIEGAGQVYIIDEDSGAEFKIDADYELFKNGGAVYVDDLLVDPTNYTSWDGSTYIKFTDEYLSTIAIGAHTLKVTFNDGGTATTTFTIAESEGDLATPNTGVFAMISGGATTTVGALAVILVVFMIVQRIIWKRQRKINESKH